MSDRARLERRYRRLLQCYPRAFRREHEDEMLVVLLACARDGRRRPGVADATNLLWNALRVWLRPAAPRSVPTVFWGVRLMLGAGVLELIALATVVISAGAVGHAVMQHFARFGAAQSAAVVHAHVLPVELGAPIAAVVWLVAAWANDRGHTWGRVIAVVVLALTSVSLMAAIGQHVASYALADLIVGIALWLAALAATLLIISSDSNCHYDHGRGGAGGSSGPRLGALQPGSVTGWRGAPDITTWN